MRTWKRGKASRERETYTQISSGTVTQNMGHLKEATRALREGPPSSTDLAPSDTPSRGPFAHAAVAGTQPQYQKHVWAEGAWSAAGSVGRRQTQCYQQ